ncbi:spore germination protein KA [Desulfonispora thiosulfatigenes DSM 11270]|uniref:Spore germination protein KA n=1 Tax=Desulfonispora thiosulfatigenes DSM 11270 TaxID=656914 RepID=A0A1W1V3N9_DESTI|nr:spore germination protein [Desulfonispora thiosulfatigenes]SMB88027.1 spore germination protein KA [Desulfonispora thiosulfatigenes DSM 11270]
METNTKMKKPLKVNEAESSESCLVLEELSSNMDNNIDFLKEHFKDCSDIVFRTILLKDVETHLIYADGMVNVNMLSRDVIANLLFNEDILTTDLPLEEKIKKSLPIGQISLEKEMNPIMDKIVSGNIVILFTGITQSVVVTLPTWEKRGIGPSENEPSIKGSKESFTETLNVNTSLIRRRLLHPDCKFETLTVGEYSKTTVVLAYVSSIVNDKIVDEVRERIKNVSIDALVEAEYLDELIKDAPLSPFPTLQSTERPDKVVGAMLEGRVAIMQENSSFVLLAPSLVADFLMSVDDYSTNFWYSSFIRNLRYVGIFFAVFLPALFVAFTAFNQEMIPTPLLITLANQREGVPFPAFVEALIMLIAFQILQEAGTRLPRPIGSTVGIVGGLIIGDAAVKAGLVSPAMVIVTAMTAISSFSIPSIEFNTPILSIQVFLLVLSGILGFWGIFIGILLVFGHIVSLRSFGIPYTTPLSPLLVQDLDDVLYRAPRWALRDRSSFLNNKNFQRLGPNSGKPTPPSPEEKKENDK